MSQPQPPLKDRSRAFLAGGLIVLATVLSSLPALRAGFIWDDDVMLTDNPFIKAANGLYHIWFTTALPDYFPLTSTSFWLEWRLWGMNATGYHLTNILLHGASAVLLWRVLAHLKIPGAWLAALVFAIHPVNVESVAWITERKNTLSLFFCLLAAYWYLRGESGSPSAPSRSAHPATRCYWLSLVAYLPALLSKTSVVMLPLVLLALAWWQRGKVSARDLRRSAPLFALSLIYMQPNPQGAGARVPMRWYIGELVEYLVDSYGVRNEIRFEQQVEEIELDLSQALSVGLIVHEAVSNSIKYAFPIPGRGLIRIALHHTVENSMTLSVSDNGIGIPPPFFSAGTGRMGLQLIRGLAGDLDASFQLRNDKGAMVNIEFRNPE